jgi:hypothetical protein
VSLGVCVLTFVIGCLFHVVVVARVIIVRILKKVRGINREVCGGIWRVAAELDISFTARFGVGIVIRIDDTWPLSDQDLVARASACTVVAIFPLTVLVGI